MITAEVTDERAFAEIKRLCYMGLDSGTLSPRVVERLRRAVPFDGYAVVTINPLTNLATDFLFSEEMGDEEDARFFIENIYFEDDVLDYGWMARNLVPAMTLSEATDGKLERALRYREYNGPKGFGPGVRAVLTVNERPLGRTVPGSGKRCRRLQQARGRFSAPDLISPGRRYARGDAPLRVALRIRQRRRCGGSGPRLPGARNATYPRSGAPFAGARGFGGLITERERPPNGGLGGRGRAAAGTRAADGAGPGRRPLPPRAGALGTVADAAGIPDGVPARRAGRDSGGHRSGGPRRNDPTPHDRLRPERPGEGGSGPRRARFLDPPDLYDPLHLGVDHTGTPLACLREGRSEESAGSAQTPLPGQLAPADAHVISSQRFKQRLVPRLLSPAL